jgi:hypothetical protein
MDTSLDLNSQEHTKSTDEMKKMAKVEKLKWTWKIILKKKKTL